MEQTIAADVAETIPVAELLAFLRQAAKGQGWCSVPERLVTEHLGVELRNSGPRFTPISAAPKHVERDKVVALIKAARREFLSYARPVATEAVQRWNLPEAAPAYRIRVSFELDAEELEEQSSGWPVSDDGKPSDLDDGDLRDGIRYALGDLDYDRVKVEVIR